MYALDHESALKIIDTAVKRGHRTDIAPAVVVSSLLTQKLPFAKMHSRRAVERKHTHEFDLMEGEYLQEAPIHAASEIIVSGRKKQAVYPIVWEGENHLLVSFPQDMRIAMEPVLETYAHSMADLFRAHRNSISKLIRYIRKESRSYDMLQAVVAGMTQGTIKAANEIAKTGG
jgi:hypothetical protein